MIVEHLVRFLGGLIASLAMLTMATPAMAQVTAPATINGAYPTGTNNQGGSTNGTANTANLTNLGSNQGVTFDLQAQITNGAGPLSPTWNAGVFFPNTTTLGLQVLGTSVTEGDLATYTVTFTKTVYGLSFRMDDINYYDSFVLYAYDASNNVIPLSVSSQITAYGTELGVSQQGNGIFVRELDGTTTAGQISVDFNAGINVGIKKIVFAQVGKNQTNYNANTTLYFTSFGWDVQKDYSDAPASYTDATHRLVSGIRLGSQIDIETASLASTGATGDDTNGVDDEDGVSSLPALNVGDTSYTIPAANISAVGTGKLSAWVDFNRDGTFQSTEYASVNVTSGTLAGNLVFSSLPAMTAGSTYARFRFTSDATITSSKPGGVATDGEVEDYLLSITVPADLAITKSNGTTSVVSGSTTTYTVTVTNNGPSAVTGAVVQDTPTSGLTCTSTNAVTITGSGVPAGSYTIANLTGSGITLGTLSSGQSAVLTFSCQVN